MPTGIPKNGVNSSWFKNGHSDISNNKGRIRSEKFKKKLSERLKGNKNTLGKHWKIKDTSKMNKDKIGKKRPPFSDGWRKKISENSPKFWLGKKRPPFSEKWKQKIRLARLKQKLPTIDTSIERKFETYLKERKINYIHPFNLGDKFQCDFYLPFLNLIVECDGTYWHSRLDMKKRDKAKDAYAKKCGFNILRLTEEQINQGQFFI